MAKMETCRNRKFNQDYKLLHEQCILSGKNFEDELFPASEESLYEKNSKMRNKNGIEWLRPNKFCKKPKFIKNGCTKEDVNQGRLKDCWFLAAITSLTCNKKLIFKIIKDNTNFDSESYKGIFHFKFWQYGEWIDVVVDDRLPTFKHKGKIELCYAKSSDEDEFWIALLEKAFAKIHGSYEALGKCGTFFEAAEDVTSGVGRKFCTKTNECCQNCQLNHISSSINFFQLEENFQLNSLMSCYIRKKRVYKDNEIILSEECITDENLVIGHSFTITGIYQINEIQLIKLRNPWGKFEWKLQWSDGSIEWKQLSETIKNAIGYKNANNGEFFMSYKDFHFYFDVVEICYLKFPYFLLEMKSINSYFISIARKYPRMLTNQSCDTIGYISFELNITETIDFKEFQRMINFVVQYSEIKTKKEHVMEQIPIMPRFNLWNSMESTQMNLWRPVSDQDEFFLRIYILFQSAHNPIFRRISAHLRIVDNEVEIYKPKCVRMNFEECMTGLVTVKTLKSY